jgi:hypothetical protein
MKKQLPFISYEKTDNINCEAGYEERSFYNSLKPDNKICIKYLNNKDIVNEDNKNIKIRPDVNCIGIEKCLPCNSKSDDLEIKYKYITPTKYNLSNVKPVCVEKKQWIWPFNYLAKKELKKKQKEIIIQQIEEEKTKQNTFKSNLLSKINKLPPPIPVAPSYLPEQDNKLEIVTRDMSSEKNLISNTNAPKRFSEPSSILQKITNKKRFQPTPIIKTQEKPILGFLYDKIHTRKSKRTHGNRMSSKRPSGKRMSGKRMSGKRMSGKRMSGKIHTRKSKRMSGKRTCGKRMSGKRMSGKRMSGKIHTRKSKRMSGKRMRGKRISGKRISGKRISGKRISGKRISGKRISGKRHM